MKYAGSGFKGATEILWKYVRYFQAIQEQAEAEKITGNFRIMNLVF
jgi:hypothetical protein